MNNVIQVLETLAGDAAFISEKKVSELLTVASIEAEQQQAIKDNNTEKLTATITDLPKIVSYSQVLPADDEAPIEDEEDDNESISQLLASSF